MMSTANEVGKSSSKIDLSPEKKLVSLMRNCR